MTFKEAGFGGVMKTQAELEARSNQQLNIILHLLVDENFKEVFTKYHSNKLWISSVLPAYCSSPNDIMPLVIKHNLGLLPCEQGYQIVSSYRVASWKDLVMHKNPYRAAIIVLILLLQGEDNEY